MKKRYLWGSIITGVVVAGVVLLCSTIFPKLLAATPTNSNVSTVTATNIGQSASPHATSSQAVLQGGHPLINLFAQLSDSKSISKDKAITTAAKLIDQMYEVDYQVGTAYYTGQDPYYWWVVYITAKPLTDKLQFGYEIILDARTGNIVDGSITSASYIALGSQPNTIWGEPYNATSSGTASDGTAIPHSDAGTSTVIPQYTAFNIATGIVDAKFGDSYLGLGKADYIASTSANDPPVWRFYIMPMNGVSLSSKPQQGYAININVYTGKEDTDDQITKCYVTEYNNHIYATTDPLKLPPTSSK